MPRSEELKSLRHLLNNVKMINSHMISIIQHLDERIEELSKEEEK